MQVKLEELENAFAVLQKVNSVPLSEITWTRDDVPVPVDPEDIKDWQFIGLTNAYFPQMTASFSQSPSSTP